MMWPFNGFVLRAAVITARKTAGVLLSRAAQVSSIPHGPASGFFARIDRGAEG